MAAKKKKAVKPQRGFQTTSVAKKVVVPVEEPQVEDAPEPEEAEAKADQSVAQESQEFSLGDAETHQLNLLAEKVKPASQKEISRLHKIIEYEKRLAESLPSFHWAKMEQPETILDLVRQSEPPAIPRCLPGETQEKLVIKAAILYGLLDRLGFSKERIHQVIASLGLLDFDEAVRWLVLHCAAKELTFKAPVPSSNSSTEPPATPITGLATPMPLDTSFVGEESFDSSAQPSSQSKDSQETFGDVPDSAAIEEDPTAAYVCAKFELLKLTRENQSSSQRSQKLNDAMEAAAKAYLFDRKAAEVAFRARRAQIDLEAKEARQKSNKNETHAQRSGDTSQNDAVVAEPLKQDAEKKSIADTPEEAPLSAAAEAEDDTIFGALDAMMEEMPTEEVNDTGTTIQVRDMKLPKQFSGKSPKILLEELVRRREKLCRPSFSVVSKSRAVRAQVVIRWEGGLKQTFTMNDVACHDQAQAYNYVATLALFALDTGSVSRQLPPLFRDLWTTLETEKRLEQEAAYREHLKELIALVEPREKSVDATTRATRNEATEDVAQDSSASKSVDPQMSVALQQDFLWRTSQPAYTEMLNYRMNLPIAMYRSEILSTLDANQVLVLCGETGSGKSTQLPVFILERELRQGKPVKVYCTQPRRISAISLAQRVSRELGDPPGICGTRQSLVGYNIRLESRVTSSTRLIYATTGIVLRMLEGDRAFAEITHLIIDEIHERSIESDFLLIVLKDLLIKRRDLKVVLMSATVDATKLSQYMGDCPIINVHGRTFPVTAYHLEDVVEMTGYSLDPSKDSPYINWRQLNRKNTKADKSKTDDRLSDEEDAAPQQMLGPQYSQRTKTTIDIIDEAQINYDLIMLLLEQVCIHNTNFVSTFQGAVLIFLPSLESIRRFTELLESHPVFGTKGYQIHPLHSSITSDNQSRVFITPPEGVRKIVVSTNIAETGVTIPDVTVVIDSGKHREMRYDEKRQLSRLVETYIAKSNAMQRRGRAGRVQEGVAFHLFTRNRFENQMADHPIPEMLRLSLQDLALRIKTLTIFTQSIEEVLSRALDKPRAVNIQRAIAALQEVKALTQDEKITPLGRHLVKLPVDVHLGKILLLACLFQCIDPALTIAAALSSKSPFVTPFGREAEAESIKRAFKTENSDFLTVHRVYTAWKQAAMTGSHFSFCRKNFLSHTTLQQIEELRQQFFDYLCDAGLLHRLPRGDASKSRIRFLQIPEDYNTNAADPRLVMACVAAGMYPKLLLVDGAGQYRTLLNNAPASVHPSSVNFTPGRRPDFGGARFITYFNAQVTKKLYVWETGSVDELAIYLLCGEQDLKLPAQSFAIDRKIKVSTPAKSALAINVLKNKYQSLFDAKMEQPTQPFVGLDLEFWQMILQVLGTEKEEKEQRKNEIIKPVMTIR